MKENQIIENVSVFNGILEQQIKYYHSSPKIKNVAIWICTHLPNDFIKEINEKKLKMHIETDEHYSELKFCNLETDDREMMLKFRELTRNIR